MPRIIDLEMNLPRSEEEPGYWDAMQGRLGNPVADRQPPPDGCRDRTRGQAGRRRGSASDDGGPRRTRTGRRRTGTAPRFHVGRRTPPPSTLAKGESDARPGAVCASQ